MNHPSIYLTFLVEPPPPPSTLKDLLPLHPLHGTFMQWKFDVVDIMLDNHFLFLQGAAAWLTRSVL